MNRRLFLNNAHAGHFPIRLHAFTLVELLTVIAIIGILSGILVPVTSSVRQSAKTATCSSNLRQIGVAFELFANEHGDTLPDWDTWPRRWAYQIEPYLRLVSTTGTNNDYRRNYDGVFHCPANTNFDTASQTHLTSYRFQHFGSKEREAVKRSTIPTAPSRTVLLLDGTGWGYFHFRSTGLQNGARWDEEQRTLRHKGKDNVLFLDGHVKLLGKQDIISDPDFKFAVQK